MELVDLLTTKLGVTEGQAKGGAGLILKRAKDNLGKEDFAKISGAAPEIEAIIKDMPATDNTVIGEVEKMFSIFGRKVGNIGSMASLRAGFFNLRLNAEMIEKFNSIILEFVRNLGGNSARTLLEKGLAAE